MARQGKGPRKAGTSTIFFVYGIELEGFSMFHAADLQHSDVSNW
jgi:hypothetical protein